VETEVFPLDVGGGEAVDAQGGIGNDEPVLDSVVQADHEGDQGVVDRLGRELAGLHGFGLVGDEGADVVDRDRSQPSVSEGGQQPLPTVTS